MVILLFNCKSLNITHFEVLSPHIHADNPAPELSLRLCRKCPAADCGTLRPPFTLVGSGDVIPWEQGFRIKFFYFKICKNWNC